jgi:RNA polymerase sigma-70 factor (ECF subfamily)
MDQAELFGRHRPLLFSIAYRMLGSVMDAEDMVQETYLRWEGAAPAQVRSPKSYLSTVVTRLCIDQLRSARAQREQYIGPWLPEPLITEEAETMDGRLELADSLSIAFLLLLERLTPTERAVFLLRDAFDYPYPEIARIVGKSEANCRQMARRARTHIVERRRRFGASNEERRQLAERFLRAATSGDMDGLVALLADDVTLRSDGGGKVAAALNPIEGPQKVARFFIGLAKKRPADMVFRPARVNGRLGMILYTGGQPYSVMTFEAAGGKIGDVDIIVNPDKLHGVPPLS